MRKTVLFFCGDTMAYNRFGGICSFGRSRQWNVKYVNYRSAISLDSYLSIWKPSGIITDTLDYATTPGSPIPTVFLDAELSRAEWSSRCTVERDSADAARLALAEFERLGLNHLAFLPPLEEHAWSDRRRDAFVAAAADKGLKVLIYPKRRLLTETPASYVRLGKWATKLPRPCGVFAANDMTGSHLLSACALNGIRIPEDLAVIGVDGNTLITDNTYPSLTSVASATEEGGRLAAELLDGLMSGEITSPQHRTFGELGLVRKESTRRIYNRESDIRHAQDLIRRDACAGLRARDVLAIMKGSRRSAETRFRAETGLSILEAINVERLEHAKRMLRTTTRPISEIARSCGYTSASYLRTIFERTLGMTAGEWRKQSIHQHERF